MQTVVLLGGNGYLGRAITTQWFLRNPDTTIYTVSTSGKNSLVHTNLINLQADCADYEALRQILPASIDVIIDLIGRPEKTPELLTASNRQPAEVMQKIAEEIPVTAMGFIGGLLGPKSFLQLKKELIHQLQQSPIPLYYVEPTLIYGGGRSDTLAALVPVFKFLGLFSKKLRPMLVDDVAKELVTEFFSSEVTYEN